MFECTKGGKLLLKLLLATHCIYIRFILCPTYASTHVHP